VSRLPSPIMPLPYPREDSLAGPEHFDDVYVEAYDRKAAFDPLPDLERLRGHGLGPQSTLIDFGAGTGTLAVAAASIARRVIAVDPSPAMLNAIGRKAVAAEANIECIEGGFLRYEHSGAPADVIYTRNALHHLPDFWERRWR
jgi:SAM-dependent methyltransferase